MAKTYTEYLQEILKSQEEEKNKQLNSIDAKYSDVSKAIIDQYSADIQSVEETYNDYIDKSYVQKIIDQKQVEQTLANMGLTDSGLNRTQQTAVEISHTNRSGKYTLLKQQQIDSLAQQMRSKLADSRMQQEKEKTSVIDEFRESAEDQAMEIFKNELSAETKKQIEQLKAELKAELNAQKNNSNLNSDSKKDSATNKEDVSKNETTKPSTSTTTKPTTSTTTKPTTSTTTKPTTSTTTKPSTNTTTKPSTSTTKPTTSETKNETTKTSLTQNEKNKLEKMCKESLVTKQQFNNERRLGNVTGTYTDYLKSTLLRWRVDSKIKQEEYEYLLSYLGLNT